MNYAFYNDVGGLPSGSALFSGSASTTATTVGDVTVAGAPFRVNLETFNISAAALLAGSYFFAIQSVNSLSFLQ